jgi:hypothetical protein
MRQELSRYLTKDLQGWFVEAESQPTPSPSRMLFSRLETSERKRLRIKARVEQDECHLFYDD